jgi:small-conductance mechanosensitive channel
VSFKSNEGVELMTTYILSSLLEHIRNQFVVNLPAFLTVFLFILAGWLIASLVSKLAKRAIRRFGLEQAYESSRLALEIDKVQPGLSLEHLVGRVVFWLLWIYIGFTGLTTSGLNIEKTVLYNILNFLPHLFVAFLILVGGMMLAQFVGRWVQVSVAATGVEYDELLGKGARLLIITVVLITSIEELGINLTPLTSSLASLIIVVIGGLALAFGIGARDVVSNILAGYYAREYFELGEKIQIDDVAGTLISIGTVSAEIDCDGNRLVLANTELTKKTIKMFKNIR